MTREEAIGEINNAFEPAFANYIIMALEQPERKQGIWNRVYVCNQCCHTEKHCTNFCSYCGAKMDEEE